jgi:hypothetical protein
MNKFALDESDIMQLNYQNGQNTLVRPKDVESIVGILFNFIVDNNTSAQFKTQSSQRFVNYIFKITNTQN